MTNKEFYIYMAGFFDADGCVGLNKAQCRKQFNKRLEVQISQVNKKPLLLFQRFFGGGIYLQKKQKAHNHFSREYNIKDIHHWVISDKQAEKCLRAIAPYMINKKEKAELALKFRELPRFNNICNVDDLKKETKQKALEFNRRLILKREKIYERFKELVC